MMKNSEQRRILDLWPAMQEHFKKFMSDRPGWLIAMLENARNKRGNKGWQDVERVIQILQFLKDTEIEYY
jgi:hypothetical protein